MLISKAQSLKRAKDPNATNTGNNLSNKLGSVVSTWAKAEHLVIRSVQHESFAKEIQLITKQKLLAKGSPLAKLNSVIDENGLLRVGGRLSRADLSDTERHSLNRPGSHHVTVLRAKHYQQQTKHQGRHFTRGRIRALTIGILEKNVWLIG